MTRQKIGWKSKESKLLANSNSKRLSERAGLFVVYEISMDHYKLQNLYCGKAFKKPFDWNNPSKPLYTYEIAEDISTTRNNQEKYYQELRKWLTVNKNIEIYRNM